MQPKPYVLVIEDVLDIADIYAEILEMEGMSVEMITDGAVALQRLETAAPDLILLDMHLPNVSGLEILTFIRNHPQLKQTKVVVITANPLLARAAEGSADLIFVKPVSTTQVCTLSMSLLV
jgi:CheY-like chemotaxis protein